MPDPAVDAANRAVKLDDPARGLEGVAALRRQVEVLEVAQVRHALDRGWSWRQIAEALGVSKQAAHKKHSAYRPKPAADVDSRQRLVITGQARRTVEHAREEARKLHHAAVAPAHLLLGLLHGGEDPVSVALERAGLDLESVRRDAQAMRPAKGAGHGREAGAGRVPISSSARGAFEQALREAVARNDPHLGREHILLALLRDADSGAIATLGRLGVTPRRLHRLLERSLAES